ncbi:TRAP transporter large permease subunit [Herbaspirillum sp. RTI4]|uniref:TRAP transporter large permease n=1 Tax=Herbaspirillum sp. RTI4 TaxID=3048640 RepID=UPI002AB342ED|nr:TRAP transporter large permease subunit [Herbaspirillum sp. RTI4]MDY7580062.1 TRAP transporter large permease subunit [Herbaspirillum sp. RTI4]MEA9983289.1 TRAP transporter large permease subunit [Herbaspirillum sp. RTI4]
MNAAIIFVLLIVLMLTGMPVSISLGLTVLTFLFTLTTVPIESVALKLFTGIENFGIMAIPFFILAGNFLTQGGVAKRMINFTVAIVGHFYGGLALAGVLACTLFAAISGSSVATVVAIGSIILPEMVKAGFPKRFGAGVITTSGALGILVPPSIVMVLYSVSTNNSVSDMFIAGIVPGIMLALMLGLTTWWLARKNDYPRVQLFPGRPFSHQTCSAFYGVFFSLFITFVPPIPFVWLLQRASGSMFLAVVSCFMVWLPVVYQIAKRKHFGLKFESLAVWKAYWDSIWGLLLIVLVIGGIYSGVFTPTEAAATAAVYAFVVVVFVYKELPFKRIPKVLLDSAAMSAMLLYIITNAVLFSFLMTSENIPQVMADWITSQGLGQIAFLAVVNILLLVAGNVMEPSSIVLVLAPILYPVAIKLGIDPIHFGVLMMVNMEVGLCHPPVGLNLYVASGVTKMGISELTVAVLPWLGTMIVFLIMITYIPQISLWLPHLLK